MPTPRFTLVSRASARKASVRPRIGSPGTCSTFLKKDTASPSVRRGKPGPEHPGKPRKSIIWRENPGSDHPQRDRLEHRPGAVAGVEFLQDRGGVVLHRARG